PTLKQIACSWARTMVSPQRILKVGTGTRFRHMPRSHSRIALSQYVPPCHLSRREYAICVPCEHGASGALISLQVGKLQLLATVAGRFDGELYCETDLIERPRSSLQCSQNGVEPSKRAQRHSGASSIVCGR